MDTIVLSQTMVTVAASAASFAIVGIITPGPNNFMLTLSGARFGFRKTIPHLLGIQVGFSGLILLLALGLSQVFLAYPTVQTVMRYVGAGYMVYLAGIIFVGDFSANNNGKARPLTFYEAMLCHVINPKSLCLGIAAISTFTLSGDQYWLSALTVVTVFFILCLPCICLWALLGQGISHWLINDNAKLIFNLAMAALLIASIYFVFV